MSLDAARRRKRSKALALAHLRSQSVTASEALLALPAPFPELIVWDVLIALPRLGPIVARRMCENAGVWPLCRLGELNAWQRDDLYAQLPDRLRH